MAKPLHPECLWRVFVGEAAIAVVDDRGRVVRLATDDIEQIVIETNDRGPWGADFWWMLFGGGEEFHVAFPQGATGEDAAIEVLMKLPGFDHDRYVGAMRSTRKARFVVWQRTAPRAAHG